MMPVAALSLRRASWGALGVSLAVLALARPVAAQPAAEEIMAKAHLAMFYPGEDMRARVTMRLVSRDGKERVRELTMSRRDLQDGGEQRYFIYFHRPPDVRDMTFLVWKYPGKDDDRWLYVPALKLVRRIAASDKRSSFAGSDFSYEDVSGREPEEDAHKLLREEEVKEIRGFGRVTKGVMKNVQTGHWSESVMAEVRYNQKLLPELFTERALRAPPAELSR